MNLIVRNIIAVIAGFITGSLVNMLIIMVSTSIILPTECADSITIEGLTASIHLFTLINF
jgi:hypothetical protein